MYNLSKVCFDKKKCYAQPITINPPTLSFVSPLCPFSFTGTCNNASGSETVVHLATVWELALDSNFVNVVSTISTEGEEKNSVTFPRASIVDGSSYFIRAFHITDLGESNWSDPINITSGYSYLNTTAELTNLGSYEATSERSEFFIHNNILHQITFDTKKRTAPLTLKINKYENESWTNLQSFNDSNSTLKNSFSLFPTFCLDGDNLYITITLATVDTFLGIYLLKYDILTNTLSIVTKDNTGLFKRDQPAMIANGDYIYFVGGYVIDGPTSDKMYPPTDTERTFLRMHKTTNIFEEVVLTDTSFKPRNYRGSKIIKVGNGFWLYGGTGTKGYGSFNVTGSPELSYFSFDQMKWTPKQIFPFLNLLSSAYIDLSVTSDNKYLNLVSVAYDVTLFTFDLTLEMWDIFTTYSLSSLGLAFPAGIFIKNEYLYIDGDDGIMPPPPPP